MTAPDASAATADLVDEATTLLAEWQRMQDWPHPIPDRIRDWSERKDDLMDRIDAHTRSSKAAAGEPAHYHFAPECTAPNADYCRRNHVREGVGSGSATA